MSVEQNFIANLPAGEQPLQTTNTNKYSTEREYSRQETAIFFETLTETKSFLLTPIQYRSFVMIPLLHEVLRPTSGLFKEARKDIKKAKKNAHDNFEAIILYQLLPCH